MKTEDKCLLHMLREKTKKACVVTRVAIGIQDKAGRTKVHYRNMYITENTM